jgi:hypothetical protein
MKILSNKYGDGLKKQGCALLIICTLSILSCSSIIFIGSWEDDTYVSHIRKIFVIGVSKRPAFRRLFEDEFVNQLKDHGIDAVSSYTVLPADRMLDKSYIGSIIKDSDFDAVLITKLLKKKEIENSAQLDEYAPHRHYARWYDYYGDSYEYVYNPDYAIEGEAANLETNVYDVKNDKLIWSVLSDTFVEGSSEELIRLYIKAIIDKLYDDRFLGQN